MRCARCLHPLTWHVEFSGHEDSPCGYAGCGCQDYQHLTLVTPPTGTSVAYTPGVGEGGVYVSCQWGGCQACEPYPPCEPPKGWQTCGGDWFCPMHIVAVMLEDGVEWESMVPDGRVEGGYRVSVGTRDRWRR